MSTYEKPDFWAQKAQKEGYPARSVYKLKEINEKFGILPKKNHAGIERFKVLDLGAAPGSWSLFILRTLQGAAHVTACDLQEITVRSGAGFFDNPELFLALQGDFTGDAIRACIAGGSPYDLLVSDAAPATTGNRTLDTLRSLDLAETALYYAKTMLKTGGNLVIKVFQGSGTAELLKKIKPVFTKTQSFKPAACRSSSFETYIIGLEKKLYAGDEI